MNITDIFREIEAMRYKIATVDYAVGLILKYRLYDSYEFADDLDWVAIGIRPEKCGTHIFWKGGSCFFLPGPSLKGILDLSLTYRNDDHLYIRLAERRLTPQERYILREFDNSKEMFCIYFQSLTKKERDAFFKYRVEATEKSGNIKRWLSEWANDVDGKMLPGDDLPK